MLQASQQRLGRIEFTLMVSAIMSLTALGIDMMLPAFDDMRADFGLESNPSAISGTVTAYFLGVAIGQIFFGLAADRYGRRPALWVGFLVYLLGAVGSALAPSLVVLLLTRLIWGFGAASARVIAVALVRDRHTGRAMAQAMSYIMSVFILVPVLAPSLGAIVTGVADWRWIFWICAIFVVVVWLWTIRLPESLAPEDRLHLGIANVVGAMKRVVTGRITGGYLLAMTILMGAFMSYIASSELIIGEIFGYQSEFPIVFGAVAAVLALGAILNARLVGRLGIDAVISGALVCYVSTAVVMVVVTVMGDGVPEFWVFMPLVAIVLGCHILLLPNMNTLAMEPVGDIAGTAAAVLGFVSLAGGAILGAMIDRNIETTVTALAVGFLAAGLLAAVTVAWIRRSAGVDTSAPAVVVFEPN